MTATRKRQILIAAALILMEVVFVRWTLPLSMWFLTLGVPKSIGRFGLFGIVAVAIMLALLAIFRLVLNTKFRLYGFRTAAKRDWETAFVCFGLLFPVAFLGRLADPGFDAIYARSVGLLTSGGLGIFLVTLPFFLFREELFLRFSQVHTSELFGHRWAIGLLAANFAMLHYPFGFTGHAWSVIVSVFFGLLVLGVLFWKTQNLWLAFAVHLAYDATISLQIFLHAMHRNAEEWLFWGLYAVLFVFVARRGWQLLCDSLRQGRQRGISPASLVFGGVCAVGLPLLLLFAF